MPDRFLKPCKQPGCPALVKSGYCPNHAGNTRLEIRNRFKKLDDKKTPEMRRFYSGSKWTETSKKHRSKNPLCLACYKKGIRKAVELTHHEPPLEHLLANGLDPYDEKYLVSSCFDHHQKELREKYER